MAHKNHKLDPRELAFCAEYARNGGNGKAAAIHAGYGIAGAAVQATRLLKRPDIQAEIKRCRMSPQQMVGELMGKAIAVVNEARPSASENPERAAMYAEADRDLAASLNRSYVIAGLIENFEMALGRKPRRTTRYVQQIIKDEQGKTTKTTVAELTDVFEVDHAGANRAGELLLAECAPEDPGSTGPTDNGITPLLEAFQKGRIFEVRPEKDKATR